jgi:hypothetical protein
MQSAGQVMLLNKSLKNEFDKIQTPQEIAGFFNAQIFKK